MKIPSGPVHLGYAPVGQVGGYISSILADQGHEGLQLAAVHAGSEEAGWLALQRCLPAGRSQNVVVGTPVYDGQLLLLLVQCMDQLEGKIVLPCKCSKALARALPNLGGIGAEEAGTVDDLAIHHRVVLAEMMALDPVAPGTRLRRCSKNRKVVLLRVSR